MPPSSSKAYSHAPQHAKIKSESHSTKRPAANDVEDIVVRATKKHHSASVVIADTDRPEEDMKPIRTKSLRTGMAFGDHITVYVGLKDQEFAIHAELIDKIPYLLKIWTRPSLDCNKGFLPDVDPELFSDIMLWVYRDQIPELNAAAVPSDNTNAQNSQCIKVMKLYSLASRLGMENLANQLMDGLHEFHGGVTGTTVEELTLVQASQFSDSPVRKLLLRTWSGSIIDHGWDDYFRMNPAIRTFLIANKHLYDDVGRAVTAKVKLPDLAKDPNFCQWHTHKHTPRCGLTAVREKTTSNRKERKV